MQIEERHRKIQRMIQIKNKETQRNERKEEHQKERQWNNEKYPPTISTMVKRIKRIDPWNTVVSMSPYDSALIVYFKFKQKGLENVRMATTHSHAWVEFEFDNNWYIIDVSAVNNKELGEPIKFKRDVDSPVYKNLVRYFDDVDSYIETYDDKLSFEKDEAKIEAMNDQGLNTFLIIKYF